MESVNNPLVSVVIPVYNMQEFVAETIESVLQTIYTPFEVIIVNDGSTDNSAQIVQEYTGKYSNIHLFTIENGGASKARNYGINKANGKYILPVDSDNIISADYISKAVEILEKDAAVKIVTCEAVFFGEKEGKWELPPFSIKLLARRNLMDNCAMYRKIDWASAGGYCDEILGREDWDFWISMLKKGGNVYRLPIVGLHYRVRSNSKRKRTRHMKKDLILQLNQRHKAFFYKQLNGPLHVSRTWSETYNKLNHIFNPEKIYCSDEFEDLVYNTPEIFSENKQSEPVVQTHTFNEQLVQIYAFKEKYLFGASQARKLYHNTDENQRIGYYEIRNIFGNCTSYFVKKKLNNVPSASLIISVYKNVAFLREVLDSLKTQTRNDFEIIIAEDGESPEMKSFIDNYAFKHPFKHISQSDEGWRKNKIMNKAIQSSTAEWLIFVDGDCIMHRSFIEMHLRYASSDRILAGKRVKLDAEYSEKILQKKLNYKDIQGGLRSKLFFGKGKIKFLEEGIYISPDSFLRFIPAMRKLDNLKGCNMSFSKKAITTINGFDEDYVLPAIGEDIDLSWRFKSAGFKHFSVRNLAIEYHLYHKESWQKQDVNAAIMATKKQLNEYICKNGIRKN